MKTNRAFVIPTVDNRFDSMKELLSSINDHVQGWDVLVVTQAYTPEMREEIENFVSDFNANHLFFHYDDMQGCFGGRKRAYEQTDYLAYCNLDDDMYVLPTQNYDAMATKAIADNSVGFISGNWGRTDGLAAAKIPKMSHTFQKSPIVHTGGGLIFTKKIKELILQLPDNTAYEDSEMTALAYINGYTNYRYLGSVIIHRVVTKGGLKNWRKEYHGTLVNEDIFNYRAGKKVMYGTKDNDMCEPMSADLTPHAKRLHFQNLKSPFYSIKK